MSDSKHVKSADVSEDHKVSESSSERTDSDKPKVQFSVRKLMLWTATVGVGLAISTQFGLAEELGVVVCIIYLGLASGISLFFDSSRSREIWFPVGMLLLIPIGFFVGAVGGVNSSGVGNDTLAAFRALGAMGGVVYGLVLLVGFVGWTQRHGFSLRLLVLWLTCWMWFMLGTLFALIGGLGGFWS
ncbi:MAG: hypothetical protein CMJ80_17840 [Planctomycetaceae bacterium]|nr:hypothetical protein [Planctomycetaceae bacterium]